MSGIGLDKLQRAREHLIVLSRASIGQRWSLSDMALVKGSLDLLGRQAAPVAPTLTQQEAQAAHAGADVNAIDRRAQIAADRIMNLWADSKPGLRNAIRREIVAAIATSEQKGPQA